MILTRDLALPVPAPDGRAELSIATVSGDTDAVLPEHVNRARARERLRSGHVVFVARWAGEMVHCTWLGFGPLRYRDIGVEIPLNPAEAYLYDAYTAPRWRGRGIYETTAGHLLRYAGGRGIRSVYARVGRVNAAGIAALQRVGFRVAVNLTSVRLFWMLGIYLARGGGPSAVADLLLSRRARMRPGVLVWNGSGRSGIRLNLRSATTP